MIEILTAKDHFNESVPNIYSNGSPQHVRISNDNERFITIQINGKGKRLSFKLDIYIL